MDSQKHRTAVINAARLVAEDHQHKMGTRIGPGCLTCALVSALEVLDRPERVTEFQAGIRRRGIKLCQVGDCYLRADHAKGVHVPNPGNRCDYVEHGLRCVHYATNGHTEHLMDDRPKKGLDT